MKLFLKLPSYDPTLSWRHGFFRFLELTASGSCFIVIVSMLSSNLNLFTSIIHNSLQNIQIT